MPRLRAAISALSFSDLGSVWEVTLTCVEKGFDPHPVPAGGLQILSGADEGTGPVVHCFAQGIEVAAGLRSQEDERLLRLGGNGDKDAFVPGNAWSRSQRG